MSSSKGMILNIKGKTAAKILAELEIPNINSKLLADCKDMSFKLANTEMGNYGFGNKAAKLCSTKVIEA